MTQTLNSAPIEKISLYLPEYGIWTARITLVSGDEFPPDSQAQIIFQDLVLNGVIKSGGAYLNKGHYFVIGGGGNWGRRITSLGERSLAGLRLSAIAKSIMEAANIAGSSAGSEGIETISVPNDRFIGEFWQRQAGLASAALSRLTNNQWYVDLDGTTILNARETTNLTQKYAVQSFDPQFNSVQITLPQSNSLIGFVPGCLITEGVPSNLSLTELTIHSNISELLIEGQA